MEKDALDIHNHRSIDKAVADFVESARRAVTAEPHGSLTLRFEWRAFGAHRFVINEERSQFLAPTPE